MQVFINDREVGQLAAEGATVGEVVEAIGAQVDPSHVLTSVELDGEVFAAGDEARWARRPATSVSRLALGTSLLGDLGPALRGEIRDALRVLVLKVELAVERLGRGDQRGANRVLSELLEELRLVLILDQQTSMLDGASPLATDVELEPLAGELLEAQMRHDSPEVHRLIEGRLAPFLRAWSQRADAPSATA